MKRLLLMSIPAVSVLAGLLYINYTEDQSRNLAQLDQATVLIPDPIDLPDQIEWIDSIRNNDPTFVWGSDQVYQFTYSISSGDTFSRILSKLGIDQKIVNQLATLAGHKFNMAGFKIGQQMIVYKKNGQPYLLEYPLSETSVLQISVDRLSADIIEKEVVTSVQSFSSTVITSLASTLSKKDIPTDLADKLLSIFAWDIDFRKLKKEDHFGIVYEENTVDGKVINTGRILSAFMVHEGKKHFAYYFENDSARGYYNQDGLNYSRAPLEYELITSLYNRRRFHPVKRRYRAHLGMDFMAEEGTPIESLKDGVVIAAGYRRANGNYVKIRHDKIITQYLHLSEIDPAIKNGVTVKRGTVIGKVGSTGLSSGPHLCLRVWHNGKQKDPLDFSFNRRDELNSRDMDDFKQLMTEQNKLLK